MSAVKRGPIPSIACLLLVKGHFDATNGMSV